MEVKWFDGVDILHIPSLIEISFHSTLTIDMTHVDSTGQSAPSSTKYIYIIRWQPESEYRF